MEEDNNFETQPVEPVDVKTEHPPMSQRTKLLTLIVISLVAGMVGGLYGAINLANRPSIQKLFNNKATTSGNVSQNVTLREESAITEVVKKASPAVVSIVISKDISDSAFSFFFGQQNQGQPGSNIQEVGAGSGFFVSKDGLILTNKHVVSDKTAQYTVVTSDGKKYDAKVMTLDPSNDLAIMKVDISDAPHLDFADSSQLELGQHVIAIGNSLGQFQNTVTSGVVSGLSRKIVAGDRTGQEQLDGIIQTDAAINPGNSGGPLINLVGQVVGVNTAVAQGSQSVGFAIPSNDAKVALDSFVRSGKIVRPFIGVRYMLLSKAIADQEKLARDHGALLIEGDTPTDFAVMPGSPADKAGLKEGDIILEIDGMEINENNSLPNILKNYKPGDRITAKVYSGGNEKNVSITLGENN